MKCLLFAVLIGLAIFFLPRLLTSLFSLSRIYSADDPPSERIAIVFGAGLYRDGSPTPILRDRVATAADLYFSGKVEKLLMSGDNRYEDYNEPGAMRDYAIQLGVPAEAIVLDYAGRRTYDTCYRSKAIFGVQSAILVTQKFHLPRALFLCSAMGIKAIGVSADRRTYWPSSQLIWNMREQFATAAAMWDVYIKRPVPVLGNPEPIFPEN